MTVATVMPKKPTITKDNKKNRISTDASYKRLLANRASDSTWGKRGRHHQTFMEKL